MIDLCKLFGVEDGEEFRIRNRMNTMRGRVYVIIDNCLKFRDEKGNHIAQFSVNELSGAEVIKIPKKQFTDDELCILRNVAKKFKWICRELRTDNILLFEEKPLKHDSKAWVCDEGTVTFFRAFDHLFKCILWEDEEPVFIDDYVERGAE